MNDRDTFAAAALTGLLCNGDYSREAIPCQAFSIADAMLRERGNHPETPDSSPVTEPMPQEKRAEVSDSEPVAWAIERSDDGSLMGFCHTKRDATRFAHAIIGVTAQEHFTLRHVPLYRHPPVTTLTDAERKALERVSVAYDLLPTDGSRQISATLRGLLGRLGGGR